MSGEEIEIVDAEVVDAEPVSELRGLRFEQYFMIDREINCFRLSISDEWMRVHEGAVWGELTVILEELRQFVNAHNGVVRYEHQRR